MQTRTLFPVAALAAVLVGGGLLLAGPQEKGEPSEQDAMMAEWMKAAQPGEHHAHLGKMAGTWKAQTRHWMQPGAEAQVTEGKATFKPVLGGRFIQSTFEGDFMGQPFHGVGFSGYDNIRAKHVDVWMDSMGTQITQSEGICEEGGKVVKMTGQFVDPTGASQSMRMITRETGPSSVVFEMYGPDPKGTEYKMMEITYTRM
ncbi:MAG: DUF1579 domain-containing protein [Acidobacteria bacterium]|nr:DUF1579 domain-containing protein [Acidobacteriota bacterium]